MSTATATREATGDLRNNLMKLTREIKRMKLNVEINLQGLSLGCPSSFLPILHASLMLYSLPLADWLTRQGFELYAKSDLRFIEGLYKVLRDVFHYRPRLSKEQFLSVGFAEVKIILTTQVLLLSQAKHRQLTTREEGKRTAKTKRVAPINEGYISQCPPTYVNIERADNTGGPPIKGLSHTFHSSIQTKPSGHDDNAHLITGPPTTKLEMSRVQHPPAVTKEPGNMLHAHSLLHANDQPSLLSGGNRPGAETTTNSSLPHVHHHLFENERSGALQPTALQYMYTPPRSPHQSTPTVDLDLTPPTQETNRCSSPLSPTHTRLTDHTLTSSTAHTITESMRCSATRGGERGSLGYSHYQSHMHRAQNTKDYIITSSRIAPNYGTQSAATHVTPHTITQDTAHTVTSSQPHNSFPPADRPPKERQNEVEIVDIMGPTHNGGDIPCLLEISSRIDGLVKMVQSMSARVDLMETHMKLVESMQRSTANNQTLSVSALKSKIQQSRHHDESMQRSTASQSKRQQLEHHNIHPPTLHANGRSHELESPRTQTAHDSNPHTSHTPHKNDHHTLETSHKEHSHTSHTPPKEHSHTPHQTPTSSPLRPILKSTPERTSTHSDWQQAGSKPHLLQQTTPSMLVAPLSMHHHTTSTPEEAQHLIESLRSRAKRTRDFLEQANRA